jgi:hypothetical protein
VLEAEQARADPLDEDERQRSVRGDDREEVQADGDHGDDE